MGKSFGKNANAIFVNQYSTNKETTSKQMKEASSPKPQNIVTESTTQKIDTPVIKPDQTKNKPANMKPYKGSKNKRVQLLVRPATISNIDKYVEGLGKEFEDNQSIKLSRNELINLMLEYCIMNPDLIRESIKAYANYIAEEEGNENE